MVRRPGGGRGYRADLHRPLAGSRVVVPVMTAVRQSAGPGRPRREQFPLGTPVAGHYRRRLVKGGPWWPVVIWFGPPPDPDHPGLELDRSPRWQAREGEWLRSGDDDIQNLWISCCREPISESEYRFMVAERAWCKQNAPDDPLANPTKPIDLNAQPSLF